MKHSKTCFQVQEKNKNPVQLPLQSRCDLAGFWTDHNDLTKHWQPQCPQSFESFHNSFLGSLNIKSQPENYLTFLFKLPINKWLCSYMSQIKKHSHFLEVNFWQELVAWLYVAIFFWGADPLEYYAAFGSAPTGLTLQCNGLHWFSPFWSSGGKLVVELEVFNDLILSSWWSGTVWDDNFSFGLCQVTTELEESSNSV